MEKLICSCCGAAIIPTTVQAFLTCEYCDTSISNPWYDEAAAAEAAKPSLQELCLKTLLEMGGDVQLEKLDPDCFGNPIYCIDTIRAGMGIPDAEQVYFLYAHTVLMIGFSDGLALTDTGLRYKCDSGEGSLSWEAFITGAISCTDRSGRRNGMLRIGTGVELDVVSDKDSRLARFLVDFHNRVYQLYTGEAAPAAWGVTAVSGTEAESPSLLGTLIPAVGALLGGSALRRAAIARRTPSMHPTSHPTVRQDRRDRIEPPRPLHTPPHGRMNRPAPAHSEHRGAGGRPGQPGRPGRGGQRGTGMGGRPGGMGGPGRGRR